MQIRPVGDTALTITLGETIDEPTHQRVQGAAEALEAAALPGVVEVVAAYAAVTLFYDPAAVVAAGAPVEDLAGWLGVRAATVLLSTPSSARSRGRVIEIPVCYGGNFGPDLARVAAYAGMSEEEVVRRHGHPDYLVYLVGFAPGFPYLGGLPKELAAPRLLTPRIRVEPGSVGIAGVQTGVYPLATPGGWNLIGRTPVRLFRLDSDPPALLRAGDRVKFTAIDREVFEKLEREQ